MLRLITIDKKPGKRLVRIGDVFHRHLMKDIIKVVDEEENHEYDKYQLCGAWYTV